MPPMQKSSRSLQSLLEIQNLEGVGEPADERGCVFSGAHSEKVRRAVRRAT
jgi:hypothetical protein